MDRKSTAITADPLDGDRLSELRYKAWGETRYALTSLPTDRRYTGQIEEAGIGLYYFNARWYDSSLGRWAQPDSIVPIESQGVQAWDRYAFVNNNPLRYNDPTGHMVACSTDSGNGCDGDGGLSPKDILYGGYEDTQSILRGYIMHHPNYYPELDPAIKEDRIAFSAIATAKYQVETQKPIYFGDWTLQVGVGVSGFLGAGLRGDASFIVDGRGNLGFVLDTGGGGYNAIGFNRFGPFLTITNAPSIEKVRGWSVQLGGQIGNGASIGGEKVLFRDEIKRYGGLSIAGGWH